MLAEWKETLLRYKVNIVSRLGILNIIPETLSRAFPEGVLKDDHRKPVTQSMTSQHFIIEEVFKNYECFSFG